MTSANCELQSVSLAFTKHAISGRMCLLQHLFIWARVVMEVCTFTQLHIAFLLTGLLTSADGNRLKRLKPYFSTFKDIYRIVFTAKYTI
jgi:hypothetical protein